MASHIQLSNTSKILTLSDIYLVQHQVVLSALTPLKQLYLHPLVKWMLLLLVLNIKRTPASFNYF